MSFEFLHRFKNHLVLRVAAVIVLLLIVILGLMFQDKINALLRFGNKIAKTSPDVLVPSIVNGELVLPKVLNNPNNGGGLSQLSRLGVISANLIGIYDAQQQKITAIRIIGETANTGTQTVDGISPVIRFYDTDGNIVGQKVGTLTTGFDFLGVTPNDKTYYDVTVSDPPISDKLEIVLNVSSSTASANFEPLKILNRNIEVKTATYQGGNLTNTQTATNSTASHSADVATSSATSPNQIEYYTVTGSVYNPLGSPISDIAVYAWVKDSEGKVFSFSRQDFKNDLIPSGDKIDFHLNLLPLKSGEKYDTYEVAAWGKEYRLNL